MTYPDFPYYTDRMECESQIPDIDKPKPKKVRQHCKVPLNSTRFTVSPKVCNSKKYQEVLSLLDRVIPLKNAMSRHCHAHKMDILADKAAFKTQYAKFQSDLLNAWERQGIFHDIVDHYAETIKRNIRGKSFRVQRGVKATVYKKDVKHRVTGVVTHHKGDLYPLHVASLARSRIKEYTLLFKKTRLSSVMSYMLYIPDLSIEWNPSTLSNEEVRNAMLDLQSTKPAIWDRAIRLVLSARERVLKRVKLAQYHSGSHRRDPKESASSLICDTSNGQYQWFLKLRMTAPAKGVKREFTYLPVTFPSANARNNARKGKQPADTRLDAVFTLYQKRGKIMVSATYETPKPQFGALKDEHRKWLGIDVNTKHNLLACDNGTVVDYDRVRIASLILLIDKIQKDSEKNPNQKHQKMDFRQKARLSKLLRANESAIQKIIHDFLMDCLANGVTDICLEDIDMRNDATFIKHKLGVKYSRLLRLLRLSNVKNWMMSQAEKIGIRVHLTHASYTSQECSECHEIERANRPTQEIFSCVSCGHTANADVEAGNNVKNRVLADVPRGAHAKLHTFDDMGRARPNKLHYKQVKSVVNAAYYQYSSSILDQPTAGFTKPLTAECSEFTFKTLNVSDITPPHNCESVSTDSLQSSIL